MMSEGIGEGTRRSMERELEQLHPVGGGQVCLTSRVKAFRVVCHLPSRMIGFEHHIVVVRC